MSIEEVDFVVVGAGIAGVSCAYFLARKASVAIVERERVPAYHTTGRSAAFYSETYGSAVVRAITVRSGEFYRHPPAGFSEVPAMAPRGVLLCGKAGDEAKLDAAWKEYNALVPSVRRVDRAEALRLSPTLDPGYVTGGIHEPEAYELDVAAIHAGFLRGARAQGATLRLSAELVGMERKGGRWLLRFADGEALAAGVVINASGAWADVVGAMAGAASVGLVPMRRTAFTFEAPAGLDLRPLPIVIGIDEDFYFKPEVGQFLASPADETPSAPCDARPDDLDIAAAVERIEAASVLRVRNIRSRWAGLRSFVKDRCFAVGYDGGAEGFFWLVGQGGYGIQSAPGVGRLSAALALGEGMPADLLALGVTEAALSPARLR